MADVWSSARLIYRGLELEDEAFLHSMSVDAESFINAAPFIPVPRNKKHAEGYREWMSTCLMGAVMCLPPPEGAAATTDGTASDKDKEAPKPIPIGVINLSKPFHVDATFHRNTEIGITIARPYHGQGYGTEAINWVLKFAFHRANLHRVGIGAFEWNTGAIRLYERLGFVRESRKRDFLWHEGKYWDLIELSMLEHEWRERQRQITSKAENA